MELSFWYVNLEKYVGDVGFLGFLVKMIVLFFYIFKMLFHTKERNILVKKTYKKLNGFKLAPMGSEDF